MLILRTTTQSVGGLHLATEALGIGVLVWNAPGLMSPEAIVDAALRGFNAKWVAQVKSDWNDYRHPGAINVAADPMVVVERTLASTLERSDRASLVQPIPAGSSPGRSAALNVICQPSAAVAGGLWQPFSPGETGIPFLQRRPSRYLPTSITSSGVTNFWSRLFSNPIMEWIPSA